MSNNKDQKTDDTQKLIKGSEYHLERRIIDYKQLHTIPCNSLQLQTIIYMKKTQVFNLIFFQNYCYFTVTG